LAETVEDRPLTEGISEAISEIILGSIKGDLELGKKTLSRVNPDKPLQFIHSAKAFSGRLAFTAEISKEKKVLVFKTGKTRKNKVADIRVKFEFDPSIEQEAVLPEVLNFSIRFPDFIDVSPEGNKVLVNFSGLGSYEFFLEGKSVKFKAVKKNSKKNDFQNLKIKVLNVFLMELASFSKQDQASPPFLIKVPKTGDRGLPGLLRAVDKTFRAAKAAIRLEIPKASETGVDEALSKKLSEVIALDQSLRLVNPYLGGPYSFRSLRSDILVKFDKKGNLVKKISNKNAQQYDLRISFLGKRGSGLDLTPKLADLLSDGPAYENFCRFFFDNQDEQNLENDKKGRQKEALEEIAKKLKRRYDEKNNKFKEKGIKRLGKNPLAVRELFREAYQSRNILFLRLKEGKESDLELIWLKGVYENQELEFLIKADFQVGFYPQVILKKVQNIRIVGVGAPGFDMATIKTRAGELAAYREFFEKYFRSIFLFKKLMAKETS